MRYLGIEQGLSNNSVRCIYQDKRGFLWFGTFDGLNCYDGYDFKVFRNIPGDDHSLPHNYINAIGEDHRNHVIIGTGQGVSMYNTLTGSFSPAEYTSVTGKWKQRIKFYVNDIKTDAKGNVYLATNGGGLLVQRADSDVAEQVTCEKGGSCEWSNVQSLVIDPSQRVWLVIAEGGLFRFDQDTRKLTLVNKDIQSIRCMEADNQGNLWISAFDGLYRYNTSTNSLTKLCNHLPDKLLSGNILSLAFGRDKQLWMGTEGRGIAVLDPLTRRIRQMSPDKAQSSLSSRIIYSIYEDREHRKWIGTYKGGIDIIEPRQSGFHTLSRHRTGPNNLADNFVNAIFESRNNDLWVGTDGGGISVWRRDTSSFTNYANYQDQELNSITCNSVPSILEDYKGDIWSGSYGSGIERFNRTTGRRKHYTCFNDETGKENPYVWRLYEDSQHTLWAATYVSGLLYYFDRNADRFVPFNHETKDFVCLTEDHAGRLWGGSSQGIYKINKQERTYSFYPVPKPVRAIFQDSRNNLWIGTEGLGLILFDTTTGKSIAGYTETNGLCNNSVLNILEDDKGNLWLSTFHGLSKFDPANRSFQNFFQADGLQSNQFEYNAALKLHSGELAFGGIRGLTIFHPDSIRSTATMPALVLNRLLINNKPVTADSKYVSKTAGDAIQKLIVPYDDGMLSFGFTALEYAAPDKISYAYYLEGWDKGWNYCGNIRTAAYTRLGEGTYRLHVRATNSIGEWNPKEVELEVTVRPPWYRSWIAYLLYAAVFAGMICLFIRYRTNRNRLQYEMKLLQIRTEQEKKKMSLFTRISHEFRTPLTLIINPVQELLKNHPPAKENNELKCIYRNARRLLSLTDQLLLFQKANTGDDPLIVAGFDYSRLCKEVYLYFEQDAYAKKIDYQLHCPDGLSLYGDRQKLEIVLINILSNAFKYTPPKGRIIFEVQDKNEEIVTVISDSGPGIPSNAGDRIFERFYQAAGHQTVSKPGFGIGLFLVKSFVDLHKGKISYSSQAGKGTSFTISLLKATAAHPTAPSEEVTVITQQPEQHHEEETLIADDTTILLIEDNEELRTYVAEIFNKTYHVIEAGSAEDGLIIAKDSLPDLIITDITMQEMTGIDLCRILKNDPTVSHIPIVMLTASNSPESKLQAIELGADDYFNKPFDKDLLVARVANLLKNRTVLQNYFYNEVTFQRNDVKVSEEYKVFLETCITIVESRLDDEDFSIQTLASAIGMSHSKLYKKVKSVSGLTVNAFIRYIRLRKAAELFIHTDMNINETAFQVGFSNVKYFQRQFFRLFGMNPSEYIKKYRKSFSKGYRLNKTALGKN
ncbi:MAG TPA: two-component regulator propeller domain-containing protein [Puia sp.]|nr:two-component regulator propeller domain-containing protein [Puia sp.]